MWGARKVDARVLNGSRDLELLLRWYETLKDLNITNRDWLDEDHPGHIE